MRTGYFATRSAGRSVADHPRIRPCGQQSHRTTGVVRSQVLRRLGRVIHMVTAVVVVMVRFILPMQHRMGRIGDRADAGPRARQRQRLPQQGQQQDKDHADAVHHKSLPSAEAREFATAFGVRAGQDFLLQRGVTGLEAAGQQRLDGSDRRCSACAIGMTLVRRERVLADRRQAHADQVTPRPGAATATACMLVGCAWLCSALTLAPVGRPPEGCAVALQCYLPCRSWR